jgi:hypothetical protein
MWLTFISPIILAKAGSVSKAGAVARFFPNYKGAMFI